MKLEVSTQASPPMPKTAMPASLSASSSAPALASVDGRKQNTGVPTVASVQAAGPASEEDLSRAVDDINKSVQFLSNGLVFSVDESSKRQIVKVVDSHTNEVIRQFPTEQALQLAKVLDQVLGKLLNEKA